MSGLVSVARAYEAAEGKTRMADGVASSGMIGSRRTTSPCDAPGIGGIVTAPSYSDQKGRNSTWRVLAELSVLSEPGNERLAMERVAEVVKELGLSEERLERLKTAVAEATMNAMEHGNRYNPDVPVKIQVWFLEERLLVRIIDRGSAPLPSSTKEVPDLETKLESMQTPRGWGLFLIQNMVDEIRVSANPDHHTIELVMHLGGGEGGS